MVYSTVVGMISKERKSFRKERGIQLYSVEILIRGKPYIVVGYDSVIPIGFSGKVEVKCYVRSEVVGSALYMYLRAISLNVVSELVTETAELKVRGSITRKSQIKLDRVRNLDFIRFTISYKDVNSSQNFVYLVARGKLARVINDLPIQSLVKVKGLLIPDRNYMELNVEEVIIWKKQSQEEVVYSPYS